MAWYNRTKKEVVLPELEKYYEAESRERSGLAWILAAISVAAVVVLLIGLFFGGRWAYRRIKNDKPVATVIQKDTGTESNKNTDKNTDDKSNNGAPVTPNTANNPGNITPAPSSVQGSAPAPTPVANTATDKKLADTGPENIFPAFIVATIVGSAYYRRKVRMHPGNN